MTRTTSALLVLLLLAGCDDGDPSDAGVGADSGPATDAGPARDGGPGGDDAGPGGSDAGPGDTDAGPASCGDQRPDISAIRGTEGVVIARDGTLYYSQRGGVGRLAPGGAPDDGYLDLSGDGAATVWGLTLDATNERLFVGSRTNGRVYIVDLTSPTPSFSSLSAGQPNGLTFGPDGALYWSEFGAGHVMRNSLDGGSSTQVTATPIPSANGVAFSDDGTLYVASYSSGDLIALTLDASGSETARTTAATGLGNPDGVAFDEAGDIYVTDNGRGRLLRVVFGGAPEVLAMGIGAAASVEFGAGPLTCTDLYVASSGQLFRYEMGTTRGRAVPWH